MDDITPLKINMAEMQTDIKYIKESMNDIKDSIKDMPNLFASKKTELIVYGVVTMVLIGFATIWINGIFDRNPELTAQEVQRMINNSRDEYLIKE